MMELNIGKQIQKLRKQEGLTQEKLAEMLGVSAAAVSKWETQTAYPDIVLLCPLARALKTSIDGLMEFHEKLSEEEAVKVLKTAEELFAANKAVEACAYCENMLKQYPTDDFLKLRTAAVYLQYLTSMQDSRDGKGYSEEFVQKQLDRAAELFESSAQSERKEIAETSWYMLSSVYMMKGESEKALEAVDRLPQPGYDARIMKAGILQQSGKLAEAEKLNQTCLYEAVRNGVLYLSGLANIARKEGENDRALLFLDKGIELSSFFEQPKIGGMDTACHLTKAEIFCEQGREEEAIEALQMAAARYMDLLKFTDSEEMEVPAYFDKLAWKHNSTSGKEFYIKNLRMLLEQAEGLEAVRNRAEYRKIIETLQNACQ